jgi:hypothetical protein
LSRLRTWWPAAAAGLLFAALAQAQPLAERSMDLDGETLRYSIRAFPPGAQLVDPAAEPEPTSALNTAKLLSIYLTAGKVEEAALLSTAPRRRFEILHDYRSSVGDEDFKQVYTQYFLPQNRLVAEVMMGPHSLLVWRLRDNDLYVGQYYVQVEGKVLMDDAPSIERFRLRRILEAVRTGKIELPAQQ